MWDDSPPLLAGHNKDCYRDAEEAQHQAKSRGKKKNLTQEEQSVQEMLKDSKTDQRYAADLLTESGQFHQACPFFPALSLRSVLP